jgi:hypothetical protein
MVNSHSYLVDPCPAQRCSGSLHIKAWRLLFTLSFFLLSLTDILHSPATSGFFSGCPNLSFPSYTSLFPSRHEGRKSPSQLAR